MQQKTLLDLSENVYQKNRTVVEELKLLEGLEGFIMVDVINTSSPFYVLC